MKKLLPVLAVMAIFLVSGCVTDSVQQPQQQDTAPAEPVKASVLAQYMLREGELHEAYELMGNTSLTETEIEEVALFMSDLNIDMDPAKVDEYYAAYFEKGTGLPLFQEMILFLTEADAADFFIGYRAQYDKNKTETEESDGYNVTVIFENFGVTMGDESFGVDQTVIVADSYLLGTTPRVAFRKGSLVFFFSAADETQRDDVVNGARYIADRV